MLNNRFLQVSNSLMIERYNKRLMQFGQSPRTLGWDRKASQKERFAAACQLFDFRGKTVCDIGCGFADFYKYLKHKNAALKAYTGIDINKNFTSLAKSNYPECRFLVRDILMHPISNPLYDCVTMFGVLNFRFKAFNNYDYAKRFIECAFGMSKEALIFDMLSSYRNYGYPKEDFVFYYSPEKIFKFAQALTPNVLLKHDYGPIPQKEFMVILRK